MFLPGHRTHPIQARLGRQGTDRWVDALAHLDTDVHTIALDLWTSGRRMTVWHHAALGGLLSDGAPVRLHPDLNLMRSGDLLLCVAPVDH
ncbi:hypothetical protein [Quadrisphaera sp. KR29]|uniref:hypothetical protein n=1 Tax=Quadrisphaera sp. KR29 TaxID=3461391 RepID=UPI004043BD26